MSKSLIGFIATIFTLGALVIYDRPNCQQTTLSFSSGE